MNSKTMRQRLSAIFLVCLGLMAILVQIVYAQSPNEKVCWTWAYYLAPNPAGTCFEVVDENGQFVKCDTFDCTGIVMGIWVDGQCSPPWYPLSNCDEVVKIGWTSAYAQDCVPHAGGGSTVQCDCELQFLWSQEVRYVDCEQS